jgi:stage V sporulation protein R
MLTVTTLENLIERIMPAIEVSGLEFGHIHFELVKGSDMQALAAYQGLPMRYAHWSFGKNYSRLKTQYDFRQSHIYELVINNRPFFCVY